MIAAGRPVVDQRMSTRDDAFALVDADGRVRARLGLDADGAVSLDLADVDGMVRATLTVEPGGSAALKLADRAGTYRSTVGAWVDGSAGLDVFDAERNHRISVSQRQLRTRVGRLSLWDAHGNPIVGELS